MSLIGFEEIHAEVDDFSFDYEDGLISFESTLLVGDINEPIPSVVINEIHYDPDVATELVEFIELYNFGSKEVDLSGWYFSDGISYSFAAGAKIPADGYVIVVQNPAHINTKWNNGRSFISEASIFGPFEFESKLSSNGEKIELCNAEGRVIDEVDYQH